MDELTYAGLSAEAWRLLEEIITTGKLTVGNVQRIATTDQILVAARYVASLRPPKERFVNLPEDWVPQKTRDISNG